MTVIKGVIREQGLTVSLWRPWVEQWGEAVRSRWRAERIVPDSSWSWETS